VAIYLVNQGQTYEIEKAGGYIWSPKLNKIDHQNKGYYLMKNVKKGDFIIHNRGGELSAISIVQDNCKSYTQPTALKESKHENEWNDDGWIVFTKYYEFSVTYPTSLLLLWAVLNYKEDSAFQTDGNIRLQYLCNLEPSHAEYLINEFLRLETKSEVIKVLKSALKNTNPKATILTNLRLRKITLENIRNFKKVHRFDFSEAKYINTVSGINGSGKSTVFECVSICQKAYYIYKYFPLNNGDELSAKYNSILNKDISNVVSDKDASIELMLVQVANEGQAERIIKLKLILTRGEPWQLSVSKEDDAILQKYWNTYNPTNIILLLDADKMVDEEDFTFQKINMMSDFKSEVIDFIIDPKRTYQNLYNIAMNTYVYNRLVPSSSAKNRKDQFTAYSKDMFREIMESHRIEISNFSGQQKEGQFVLLASKNGKYDMRQMSSGEKLIWYILLLFNYIKSISVLIIDEPENHLHEQLSWELVKYLRRINEQTENSVGIEQVYLLTHAKNLIYNNFDQGTNYLLNSSTELKKISRVQCEDILRECGISYIDDKVLYVEGDTEISLLSELCSESNIKVRQLANCEEILRVFGALRKVKELVYVPQYVFLIDKDTRDDADFESMRAQDPYFFDQHFSVLPCHEIENLFLDEDIICTQYVRLMNSVDPDYCKSGQIATSEDILKIIKCKADEVLEETKKQYLNYRLHRMIGNFSSLVDKKTIKMDSKDVYNDYINNLFTSPDFSNRIEGLKTVFDEMSDKYSELNWEKDWKDLCTGKEVYTGTVKELTRNTTFKYKALDKNIRAEIRRNADSRLNRFWKKIQNLFETKESMRNNRLF